MGRLEQAGRRLLARVIARETRGRPGRWDRTLRRDRTLTFHWDQLITLGVVVGAIWIIVQNIPAAKDLAATILGTLQTDLNNILTTGNL